MQQYYSIDITDRIDISKITTNWRFKPRSADPEEPATQIWF